MKEREKYYSFAMEGGTLTVRLAGEIDHHSAIGVRSEVDALIFEMRPQKLVLDLSQICFMDSSGLGLIMGRYSLMKELGGTLGLLSPSDAVMKIIKLAGMERIVKIEGTGRRTDNETK